ncbi:MAG: DUF4258 domain-containing protein [Aigarchaeota archaeon]|nr:DUF4258 domain-containing protein [Candidatus Pelearchaeum maunauluense]
MVRIELTRHAEEKIRVRRVDMNDVLQIISRPNMLFRDVESDTLVAIGIIGQRMLVIVFTRRDDMVRIVTVYYSSSVDKLIRRKVDRGVWVRA